MHLIMTDFGYFRLLLYEVRIRFTSSRIFRLSGQKESVIQALAVQGFSLLTASLKQYGWRKMSENMPSGLLVAGLV